MAHRILVQLMITGTQVFGKAFAEAYRQASSASVRSQASAAVRQKTGGLTLSEACQILDIEPSKISSELIKKKYDYLFEINSKEKSGSFYLQSKVYRSMERLTYEVERNSAKTGGGGGAGGAGGTGASGGSGAGGASAGGSTSASAA